MKSKKSFFSKAIIGNNLMRFWWSSALATFILFLVVPLQIMDIDVEYFLEYDRVVNLHRYISAVNLIFSIFSVIAASPSVNPPTVSLRITAIMRRITPTSITAPWIKSALIAAEYPPRITMKAAAIAITIIHTVSSTSRRTEQTLVSPL